MRLLLVLCSILSLTLACEPGSPIRVPDAGRLHILNSAEPLLVGEEEEKSNKDGHEKPLLGVQFRKTGPLNEYPELKGKYGVKVVRVVLDSAADKVGLKSGDIIIAFDGRDFDGVDVGEIESTFRDYLRNHKKVGDSVRLRLLRIKNVVSGVQNGRAVPLEDFKSGKVETWANKLKVGGLVDIKIRKQIKFLQVTPILQSPHYFLSESPDSNSDLIPSFINKEDVYIEMAKSLIDENDLNEAYQGLLKRYAEDEWWDDGLRLKRLRFVHRDPFLLPQMSEQIVDALTLSVNSKKMNGVKLIEDVAEFIDATNDELALLKFEAPKSLDVELHIDYLVKVVLQARDYRYLAFRDLGEDDQKFLYGNAHMITDRSLSLSFNSSSQVSAAEKADRVLNLASKIHFDDLLKSSRVMMALTDPLWLKNFKVALDIFEKSSVDSVDVEGARGRVLYKRETKFGDVVIGSKDNNQYAKDVAVLIDTGGDDIYRNNAGGANGTDLTVSLLIDFLGNDTYSATDKVTQGSGFMGMGLLIEMAGDDEYWSSRLSQGFGYMGVGVLWDKAGDDRYHGQEFHQGFGMWGAGVLVDESGSDEYSASLFSQGVGSGRGLGLLLDVKGDDLYEATGKYKSTYGSRGIYSGYSQGFGIGIRSHVSGGMGILLDQAGKDVFRAGNFSQGGGYFFGYGILKNSGRDADEYYGSRYAQGFQAHSAAGILIDDGGDDLYRIYVGAGQAAAWDLGVAALIDKQGNDTYDAHGLDFSQGAAAHNGFSLFIDEGGKDTYVYGKNKRARVPSNSYHKGISFGFFFDNGGAKDSYDGSFDGNGTTRLEDEYGFFIDLK